MTVLSKTMKWRFAELPVRTKFMVTLGIPMLGMVVLIGKQIDSSLKRLDVMGYIIEQSRLIGRYADVMNEVQHESALSVGYLTGQPVLPMKLTVQYAHTDEKVTALDDPTSPTPITVHLTRPFEGIHILRQRVVEQRVDAATTSRSYRAMDQALLDEMARMGKLALDPDTKDRLYAHLRLLNAKEALSVLRDKLTIGYANRPISANDLAELGEQVSAYETNMLLFERDAPPEVLGTYHQVFQGGDVNFMRSLIGTVKQRRSPDLEIAPRAWWELSLQALEKLRAVEVHSLELITQNTAENSRYAEIRLLIVLGALLGVVGAVTIMGVVITKGVRNTVTEVSKAARSLAVGDVSAKVPVNSTDEIGEMARSFNGMIENIRSLANSAESIGKGDYDTAVTVRGPQDMLGLALARMRENLKAARLRDDEQTRSLKEEKEKFEQANERIRVLIKEMHHRVKNNLQVIASLLRLQAGSFNDERMQQALDQSQSRVSSMALIHEKLYKGDELASLDVALYINELFAELIRLNDVQGKVQHRTDIDPGMTLGLNTIVPFGLLLNELITNSLKHAFRDRAEGMIDLSLHHVEGANYDLRYADDGTGIAVEKIQPSTNTLGTSLIESLVEQLNGRMSVDGGPTGTIYHIRFMVA